MADITLAFTTAASISGTAQEGSTADRGGRHAQRQRCGGDRLSVADFGRRLDRMDRHRHRHVLDLHADESDEGKFLRVVETAHDSDGGPNTTSTSAATLAVADITLAFTSAASISGTAKEGTALTAVTARSTTATRGDRLSVADFGRRLDRLDRHRHRHVLDLHADRERRGQVPARHRDGARQRRRPEHDLDQRGDAGGGRHHPGVHLGGLDQRHREGRHGC